jgi:hypothetical protein
MTYSWQVEKLYDIATNAIRSVQSREKMLLGSRSSINPLSGHQEPHETCSPPATENSIPHGAAAYDWQHNSMCASSAISVFDFANRYLAIFATFRGGKHPYLKPYMRILCQLDLP